MGAALKLDPTRIQITEFWKVKGDPLARALRNKFKKEKLFPKRKFQCVYSDELIQSKGEGKGSLVHITAIFGFMLAGLVVQDATTSISTNAPFGKFLTATAERAGYGSAKNSA